MIFAWEFISFQKIVTYFSWFEKFTNNKTLLFYFIIVSRFAG